MFDAENIIENTEDTAVKIEEYQGKKCLTWADGSNTKKQRFMQGEFKENTQYTFRFSGYSKNNMQISIVYTDGSYRGMTIQGGEEWNEIIFQSTSGKSIDYWRGWHNYSQKVAIDIDSSMIIEGSYTAETLPQYEPYKPPQSFNVYTPEQLHGVGDAHDTVILDFDKQKAELVQEVNKIVMTGNERIHVYENPPYPSYNGFSSYTLLNGKKYSREEYFSNYFGSSGPNILWIGVANYVTYFVNSQFYNAELEDKGVSNFVTFLKQQYDSGNPATIYYDNSRYEPTTTDITSLQDWDALPQLHGTWILAASGGTEPTLKAEYYSEERSTE